MHDENNLSEINIEDQNVSENKELNLLAKNLIQSYF